MDLKELYDYLNVMHNTQVYLEVTRRTILSETGMAKGGYFRNRLPGFKS